MTAKLPVDAAPEPLEPELRDILAALAPITFEQAQYHSGIGPEYSRLMTTEDRAPVMTLLAAMRYEYADAMLLASGRVLK